MVLLNTVHRSTTLRNLTESPLNNIQIAAALGKNHTTCRNLSAFLITSVQTCIYISISVTTEIGKLINSMDRVLPEKLVKKFPVFYGTRRFITTFQKPATCPQPQPDQSSPCPHPTSRRSILVLPSNLSVGSPSGLLRFPHQKPICTSTCYIPCPSHFF